MLKMIKCTEDLLEDLIENLGSRSIKNCEQVTPINGENDVLYDLEFTEEVNVIFLNSRTEIYLANVRNDGVITVDLMRFYEVIIE